MDTMTVQPKQKKYPDKVTYNNPKVIHNINQQSDEKKFLSDPLVKMMTKYYNDPVTFSIEILGCEPDDQQATVLNSILKHPKLSIRSGRGVGKSYTSAILILWFIHTRQNAQIYLTAPSQSMLTAVWSTVSKLHHQSVEMFRDRFDLLTTSMKHKKYPTHWYCMQQTSRKDKPESMAGKHNINMLYILEEASGIDDDICNIMYDSMTEEENYMFLISNPRKLSGFFYLTHCEHTALGKQFKAMKLDYKKSKWIKEGWEDEKRLQYGYKSNQYLIEVEGEFPTADSEMIIPWDLVEEAANRETKPDPKKDMIWGIDLASAGDRCVLIRRRGNYVYDSIEIWQERDMMKTVAHIKRMYDMTPKADKPAKICIDNIAIGEGAFWRLAELNLPVYPADVRENPGDSYYFNCKAKIWDLMARWFVDDEPRIPRHPELMEELTTVKGFIHNVTGKRIVESKNDYKNRQRKSPDLADSLALTFFLERRQQPGIEIW
jgi:hypothetical protein